jgi:hypothetical protein
LKIWRGACKPDSVRRHSCKQCRDDHSSSPGLAAGIERPTRGFILPRSLHRAKGSSLFRAPQRAGPALPSYLVLHHAGFAVPPSLLPERWALTPPFHPCLRRVPFEDVPKVFLRVITGIRIAGGLFSVALSVNSSTGFKLWFLSYAQTQVCATAPLALPGALPFTLRTPAGPEGLSFAPVVPELPPGISTRKVVSGLSSRSAVSQPNQRSSSSPAAFSIPRSMFLAPRLPSTIFLPSYPTFPHSRCSILVMRTREAKDFLVQQTAQQASLEKVPFSDLEKRMLYFTETGEVSEDPIELNNAFEVE